MIYSIINDENNAVVYDPRIPEAIVTDPKLHRSDNSFGSLRFTMFPNHPEYKTIRRRKSIFSVYRNGEPNPIFRGICVDGSEDHNQITRFYFEDFMSVLRDSIFDAFEFHGEPVELLRMLIDNHNNQVEPWQRITLGHVTVTDPNNYIYRMSESELTTWEVIKTRLFGSTLGGHVRMRYVNGVNYLDYLEGDTSNLDPYISTSTQVIEIGENLKDFERVITSEETYSACIPKGAELMFYNEDGEEYRARLTVASVNDGSKYLINREAVEKYGFRCAPIDLTTWDDVTLPENLLERGLEYLQNTLVKLSNSIKLSAIDLKHLGADTDAFDFLQYVRVSVYTLDLDDVFLLTDIDIPLDDPSEIDINLGEVYLSLVDRTIQQRENLNTAITVITEGINETRSEAATRIDQTTEEIRSLINNTGSSILSQVSKLYLSTSSYEEFRKEVSTLLTQTENSFNFQFDSIASRVTMVEGSANSQFSKISKYIRFVDGQIILGESGNSLILKIANDRISFIADNTEIAYFSSGRLYVDQLQAITSLTIGSFAFLPNKTGGMTLKYIGT